LQLISFVVVLIVAVAIFFTTPIGRRIAARVGFRPGMKDPAPKQDRDYLLGVCGGDRRRLEERLAEARGDRSELTEREVYRAAIRTHLRDKM